MYLKSLTLNNFRKFGVQNNTVEFVNAEDYKKKDIVNIAPKATLIVGKNNSGKTTVIDALIKLMEKESFNPTDFNYNYLKILLEKYTPDYLSAEEKPELPQISFFVAISIEANKEDLLTNIIPFMTLEDANRSEVMIQADWTVQDKELFIKDLKSFLTKDFKSQKFDRFLELLNKTRFELTYLDVNGQKKDDFSFKKLVEIKSIKANRVISENTLSNAFSQIVEFRYKNSVGPALSEKLDKEIIEINEKFSKLIKAHHSDSINSSLAKMVLSEKCQVLLKSDLNFQKLLQNVLKYEYSELNNNIPENQFGLGYTNLMVILADIIIYMEKYPETAFNSQINLITIEEPEIFMHPQMQELFIKNINEMISSLIKDKNKHVNSQLIITTHSSHILNSKIHEGYSFNNINYITNDENYSKSISLNDEKVVEKIAPDLKEETLKFISKHIKYEISQLFFADAVIFVEGATEYTLLKYFLDKDIKLNKYYITIVLVDGAHAKVYQSIIGALGIPTVIFTDIDYKREKTEKGEKGEKDKNLPDVQPIYLQMTKSKIKERITTNSTIKEFYNTELIKEIIRIDYPIIDKLKVVCQSKLINGYYATSFEEAFLLSNADNEILNKTLKALKPDIYKEVIDDGGIVKNSFKLQCKLASEKSKFANLLLYNILICENDSQIPILPKYLLDGIKHLKNSLGGK